MGSQITAMANEVKGFLRHFSKLECLEVVGIPSSIDDTALEDKVCELFCEIWVKVAERDIQNNPLSDLKRKNYKYYERKYRFAVLILQCWTFHRKRKFLLLRVYAPTIGAAKTNVKNFEGHIWFIITTRSVGQSVLRLGKMAP